MNEVAHRQAEYKAKQALRNRYTSHRTSVPVFENEYEEVVGELAENIYQYVFKYHGESKARHYCYTVNLDPDKYIE